jgi:hypothetical protein
MTITVSGTEITFNDNSTQSTAAASSFSTITTFTSSGTWNIPAGVTKFMAIVIGGGGGGGAGSGDGDADNPIINPGGFGGYGGLAIADYIVNGTTATITVGAGGAGSNSGNGGNGGTSNLVHNSLTVSATGGTGTSVNGTGTGSAQITTNISTLSSTIFTNLFFTRLLSLGLTNDLIALTADAITRPRGASSTAAIAWSSAGSNAAGARGTGESSAIGNDASGGVNGAVFIIH